MRVPWQTPGLFDDLKDERVDTHLVPGIAAVSTISLIGGASLVVAAYFWRLQPGLMLAPIEFEGGTQ